MFKLFINIYKYKLKEFLYLLNTINEGISSVVKQIKL